MLIDTLNYTRLRNGEANQFGADLHTILNKFVPRIQGLNVQADNVKAANQKISDLFAKEKKSKLSKKIENADLRRDDAVTGIKQCAEAFVKHFNPNFRKAAQDLLDGINKYGANIAGQNYIQESAILKNLSEDFENNTDLKNALTVLNIVDWAAELNEANKEFNALFLQRNEDSSRQKPDVSMKELRIDFKVIMEKTFENVYARHILASSDDVLFLIGELNTLIAKFNKIVLDRQNKGGDDNEEEDDDETNNSQN